MCCFIKRWRIAGGEYNEILNEVSDNTKIRFDSERAYIEKYLKTKIKSYKEKKQYKFS